MFDVSLASDVECTTVGAFVWIASLMPRICMLFVCVLVYFLHHRSRAKNAETVYCVFLTLSCCVKTIGYGPSVACVTQICFSAVTNLVLHWFVFGCVGLSGFVLVPTPSVVIMALQFTAHFQKFLRVEQFGIVDEVWSALVVSCLCAFILVATGLRASLWYYGLTQQTNQVSKFSVVPESPTLPVASPQVQMDGSLLKPTVPSFPSSSSEFDTEDETMFESDDFVQVVDGPIFPNENEMAEQPLSATDISGSSGTLVGSSGHHAFPPRLSCHSASYSSTGSSLENSVRDGMIVACRRLTRRFAGFRLARPHEVLGTQPGPRSLRDCAKRDLIGLASAVIGIRAKFVLPQNVIDVLVTMLVPTGERHPSASAEQHRGKASTESAKRFLDYVSETRDGYSHSDHTRVLTAESIWSCDKQGSLTNSDISTGSYSRLLEIVRNL